jgi:hypothetical protein
MGPSATRTSNEERRREIRCDPNQASLTARVGGQAVELIDVSRGGLALRVPKVFGQKHRHLAMDLCQNDVAIARVKLRITHETETAESVVLGGRIEESTLIATRQSLSPRAGDVVEVRDPALRSSIIEQLRDRAHAAVARFESGRSAEVTLGRASQAPDELAIRSSHLGNPASDQFVSVEVSHCQSRFVIEATVVATFGDECVLSTPFRVLSLCRRQCERVPVPRGQGFLRFNDVLDPERTVEVPLVDLSPGGLAIELPPGSLLPPPPIPATIRVGEQRFRVLAEVQRVNDASSTGSLVGLRFKPLRQEDLIRIGRVCQSLRFPNLVQRREVDPSAVVELMQRSGYLALREGTGPSREWHAAPGDESLSVDTVFRAENGAILGHFSCARIYPRTWILHQLATVGLRRARIAYPLYIQLMEWIAALAPEDAYGIAYFNQERSWHQALFGTFVRWVGSEALSLIAPLDRFEPTLSASPPRSVRPDVVVRSARQEELPFAVSLARSKLPPLLCDALHLREDALDTPSLCDAHTQARLERGRRTLVVEAAGELVGVALCETGAADLSLFNLLNCAYLFFRDPMPPALARSAQTALFDAVSAFYAERTGTQPLIVSPAGNAQFAGGAGYFRAETMGVWAASMEGMKQWRNYLHFCLGSAAERRRPRVRDAA